VFVNELCSIKNTVQLEDSMTIITDAGRGRENAIEAYGLRKTYPGDVRALDGVDFTVDAGTIFALLGPNGAGKSTTVKILTTLSRPDEGEARVAGVDVLRNPDQLRRQIGVVGQRAGIDPQATGRENLVLQGEIYRLPKRELRPRSDELLDRFGLSDAADRLARTYSGGMQRRLDIAMGLVHRPQVLFLDEPTTGLDPEARAAMWDEMSRLAAEEELTVLLTTHYLEEADRLAARLAIVDRGKVVAEGSPEGLKAELRGDAIQLELATPESNGRVPAVLARVDGVHDVVLDGVALRARADSGPARVHAVLAALDAAGVKVATVSVARPSLDDVYLRYAGRSFHDADDERRAA
jgi:ABC-2 type transport system ATP-binding protein